MQDDMKHVLNNHFIQKGDSQGWANTVLNNLLQVLEIQGQRTMSFSNAFLCHYRDLCFVVKIFFSNELF